MIDETTWTTLQQAKDMTYFRADLCLYSPESYTLEEKREICNDMISTSKAMLDAMRNDFEQFDPEGQRILLNALCASGVKTSEWWRASPCATETRSAESLKLSNRQLQTSRKAEGRIRSGPHLACTDESLSERSALISFLNSR